MQAVVRVLAQYILVPIAVEILKLVGKWLAREARLRSLEAENKQIREQQERASTEKEREDAAISVAGRFNRD